MSSWAEDCGPPTKDSRPPTADRGPPPDVALSAPASANPAGAPAGRLDAPGGPAALLPHQKVFRSAPRRRPAPEPSSAPRADERSRGASAKREEPEYDGGPRGNKPGFQLNGLKRIRDENRNDTNRNAGDPAYAPGAHQRRGCGWKDGGGRGDAGGARGEPPRANAFRTAGHMAGRGDGHQAADAPPGQPAPDPNLTRPYKPPGGAGDRSARPAARGAGADGRRKKNPVAAAAAAGEEEAALTPRTRKLLRLGDDEELPESLETFELPFIERVCNEVVSSGGPVHWDDIAGCKETKKIISEVILLPIINPKLFTGVLTPPRGILLFGPPGTGKTMIGRAIASNINATFFSISATSLTSKWIGEGEKMVRTLFAVARHVEPSVIFIDEIDSLLSARKSEGEHEASRRMKNQFLVEMEGCAGGGHEKLLIVGATNRPEEIDEAARRRLPKQIYVPLPDAEARMELIRRLLSTTRYSITDKGLLNIVKKTEGYSGSDIRHIIGEAAMEPVRSLTDGGDGGGGAEPGRLQDARPEDMRPVTIEDFKYAVHKCNKSVSENEIERYEAYNREHGTRIEQRRDEGEDSDGWSD